MRGALGEKLAEEFITLKRMEWIEYSRHVSDWETDSLPGVVLRRSACAESSDCW